MGRRHKRKKRRNGHEEKKLIMKIDIDKEILISLGSLIKIISMHMKGDITVKTLLDGKLHIKIQEGQHQGHCLYSCQRQLAYCFTTNWSDFFDRYVTNKIIDATKTKESDESSLFSEAQYVKDKDLDLLSDEEWKKSY